MTHHEARNFMKELGYGWRLPFLLEIMPLVVNEDVLKETVKVLGNEWVWLNDKFSASRAWLVSFGSGYCNHLSVDIGYIYVRAVRCGQSS